MFVRVGPELTSLAGTLPNNLATREFLVVLRIEWVEECILHSPPGPSHCLKSGYELQSFVQVIGKSGFP